MFDVGSPELLLVAVVAIVVIGPKDLPKAMRVVGYWVGKARGTMRQFRAGFDAMVREAELAEMEKRWAEENKRIMAAHPPDEPDPAAAGAEAPAMVEKPAVHDEPELPLEPAPEGRAS
jgi:sec-independent protein translocase protein TatB